MPLFRYVRLHIGYRLLSIENCYIVALAKRRQRLSCRYRSSAERTVVTRCDVYRFVYHVPGLHGRTTGRRLPCSSVRPRHMQSKRKGGKAESIVNFFSSQNCWEGHIAIQVELNQVLSSTCPVPKCPAQLHPQFILLALGKENSTFKKYEQAVIRSYVEESKKLTWCRNPQGCDQILVHSGIADIGTCTKCEWTSCFLCTFGEAKKDDERTRHRVEIFSFCRDTFPLLANKSPSGSTRAAFTTEWTKRPSRSN